MPIYVYKCPNGHILEQIRAVDQRDDLTPCVACNEKDGSIVEMRREPASFSGRVIGGTPTFHPGRAHK